MTPAERTAMTDKATLEEIEARLAECNEDRRDVLTGGYGVRLLEICREQAGAIRADDERLERPRCASGASMCEGATRRN